MFNPTVFSSTLLAIVATLSLSQVAASGVKTEGGGFFYKNNGRNHPVELETAVKKGTQAVKPENLPGFKEVVAPVLKRLEREVPDFGWELQKPLDGGHYWQFVGIDLPLSEDPLTDLEVVQCGRIKYPEFNILKPCFEDALADPYFDDLRRKAYPESDPKTFAQGVFLLHELVREWLLERSQRSGSKNDLVNVPSSQEYSRTWMSHCRWILEKHGNRHHYTDSDGYVQREYMGSCDSDYYNWYSRQFSRMRRKGLSDLWQTQKDILASYWTSQGKSDNLLKKSGSNTPINNDQLKTREIVRKLILHSEATGKAIVNLLESLGIKGFEEGNGYDSVSDLDERDPYLVKNIDVLFDPKNNMDGIQMSTESTIDVAAVVRITERSTRARAERITYIPSTVTLEWSGLLFKGTWSTGDDKMAIFNYEGKTVDDLFAKPFRGGEYSLAMTGLNIGYSRSTNESGITITNRQNFMGAIGTRMGSLTVTLNYGNRATEYDQEREEDFSWGNMSVLEIIGYPFKEGLENLPKPIFEMRNPFQVSSKGGSAQPPREVKEEVLRARPLR